MWGRVFHREVLAAARYPPGHGDLFYSMAACGVLDELVTGEDPKEYMFVSNVDNLCATVDLDIFYHLVNSDTDFAMEVRGLRSSCPIPPLPPLIGS